MKIPSHKLSHEELVRQLIFLEDVLKINLEIAQAPDLNKAMDHVVRGFVRVSQARSGSLMLVNEQTACLEPQAYFGDCWLNGRKPRAFEKGTGIAGLVWQTRRPFRCDDVRQEPRYLGSDDPRGFEVRSLLSVPLIGFGGDVIGVINVDSSTPGFFDAKMEKLLLDLANRVVSLIEKTKALQEAQHKAETLARLNKIGAQITMLGVKQVGEEPHPHLAAVIHSVVDAAVSIIGADTGTIHFGLEPSSGRYRFEAWAGERLTGDKGRQFLDRHPPRRGGIGEDAIRARDIITISTPEELRKWHTALFEEGLMAVACCPVIVSDDFQGILYLHFWERAHHFTQTEKEIIRLLARNGLIAVQNAMLFEEREHLLDINQQIALPPHSMDALLRLITQKAVAIVGGNASSNAYLYDASKDLWADRFSCRIQFGERRQEAQRNPRVDGMGAWVIQHKEPLISDDLARIHPGKLAEGAQVAICLPLTTGDEVLGLLYVCRRDARRFSADECRLLEFFSRSAAIAIKNAQLVRDLDQSVQVLTRLHELVIAIAAKRDLNDILDLVIDIVVGLLNAPRGWIKFFDATKGTSEALAEILRHKVWRGCGEAKIGSFLQPGVGVQAYVAKSSGPLLVHDCYLRDYLSLASPDSSEDARSVLIAPLKVAGVPIGVINLEDSNEGAFTASDKRLLGMLADHAALAIFHAILEEIDRTLTTSFDLDKVLELILGVGLTVTGAEYGSLRLLDWQRGELVLQADCSGSGRRVGDHRLPVNEKSVVGWVATHKKPVCIGDLTDPSWAVRYLPLVAGVQMRSELAVPLLGTGGALEGVLNLESSRVNAFGQEAQEVIEALAMRATIAVQRNKIMQAASEIGRTLVALDEQALFNCIVTYTSDLVKAPICTLWVLDPDDRRSLIPKAAIGRDDLRLPDTKPISLDDSLLGLACREQRLLYCPDLRQEARFRRRDLAHEHGWVSALIVPLSTGEETAAGVLSLYTSTEREFLQWEKELLVTLASYAAIAIQRARNLQALSSMRRKQVAAETVAALGDIIFNEFHDVIGNEVAPIIEFINAIEEKSAEPLSQDGYLRSRLSRIKASAEAARERARNLMRPFRLSPPGPANVVTHITKALKEAMVPSSVEVKHKYSDSLPKVMASEELYMAFENLIENAVKAMNGEGTICINATAVNGQWVEVAIADSGPGIPRERWDEIFELGATSGSSLGGGLWWVNMYVQRFGGTVHLESTLGVGSTFLVRLPQADGSSQRGVDL